MPMASVGLRRRARSPVDPFFCCTCCLAPVRWPMSTEAWADPLDRVQMHRNGMRGVPYLPLAQLGAAERLATIRCRSAARIELDGDPLLNVRGNVYPIDVDGDGGYGFVHFNGYRYMRVYDAGGRKLWQVDNPARPRAPRHDAPRHAGGARRRRRRRPGHRPLLGRGRQEGADGAARQRRRRCCAGPTLDNGSPSERVPDRGVPRRRPRARR